MVIAVLPDLFLRNQSINYKTKNFHEAFHLLRSGMSSSVSSGKFLQKSNIFAVNKNTDLSRVTKLPRL